MTRDRQRQIRRNLEAMLDATSDLLVEVGVPATAQELREGSRVRQLAFLECVRRVGEAVAQIDSVDATWLGSTFPDVPWAAVKSTRNRITHSYWTIDFDIIHDIAVIHLPRLTAAIAPHLDMEDPYVTSAPAPTGDAENAPSVAAKGRGQPR